MQPKALKPRKAINKAFLKIKPNRTEIERFKANLIELLDRTNDTESEEFHKNLVSDFLKKTYYDPSHFINTKGRNDLVIHNGNKAKSSVGVIIEAKKPTNRAEMVTGEKLNAKAFQELVLYYLRERIAHKNLEVKQLVVTNINEWFIFDANSFERLFAQNKALVKQFTDFEAGRLAGKTTDFFYREIAEPFINTIKQEIEFTYFDIREYEKPLRNDNPNDDNKLIALFKLLSPEHLLKLPFANDSNSLDKRFYGELLHIIGLSETKEGSKKLIARNKPGERNNGSLLENAIIQLDSLDKISRLDNPQHFGVTYEERLFNVGLELAITWVNRILFLKLLEAQLLTYHKGDKSYEFLSHKKIHDYDDLNGLFFQILARKHEERTTDLKDIFAKVPYLNSSLFEPTGIEHATLFISNLRDEKQLPLYSATVLKTDTGKKRTGSLSTLEYLFEFLNAYDFSSEGKEEIQEDNKTLINASVLGLIFEKINGYKDGSFFTPGFITMYMCRETIRKAVVQKFNETKNWDCKDIDALYDKIEDRAEANQIVNSLKICDPAVGSGHFLVSALNEMIAIKNDLKILQDRDGKRLKEYQFEVVNDELIVTDEDGELFEYNPTNKESQRIQQTLFHEKQTIIENCLFGVDINPNSVKICRLRLWIELLKNAYYKTESELETLPNIDINIKRGNSLISRFALDADLKKALKSSKWTIDSYRVAVDTYRNAQNKEQKRAMEKLIADIKSDFRSEISLNDPKVKRLNKLKGELFGMTNQTQMFEMSPKEKAAWNKKLKKLGEDTAKLETEIEEIKNNKIYEDAFEWRFEFPEVLDDNGDFVGFDVVIGNPPWGATLSKEQKAFLKLKYSNIDSSTPNTFAYFMGLSFSISHSFITQILPDSILVKDFSNTRELCASGLYNLAWYQNTAIPDSVRPFIDVEHDVCTLFLDLTKEINESTISTRFYKNLGIVENKWLAKKNDFILKEYDNTYNILLDEKDINILNKLRDCKILDDYLQCHEGIHSGNIREKLFIETKTNDFEKPMFLGGRNGDKIENYISYRFGWFVDYRKEIIDKDKNEYASLRDERIFNNPKIYLTRTGNPFKAFIDKSNYASNNFFSIQFKDYEFNSYERLLPVLGLLNSKFANYYIRRIIAPSLGNTFVETKIIHILKLPFLKSLLDFTAIIDIINYLITLKEEDENFDTTQLEAQIDQLVYELYGLTEEEVAIVEGATS
ncbi:MULTISPECIES: Eco57I restriction-modification methylase domain-containing protein [Aequorivita]|uniref:site-specific DNA-methyltransferase (adenine-specific) n=1 Tax=Aequorivita iocasae TaxID=2803865 RepID=A0ABX7DS04_9FLAO|nr:MULTISPECIES: TaqI-like C-terminal specificity domain-containing protein [Aequorivita]QQX76396.1 type II restriction endonuclease [Aequorivita iocasae]UCA55865.1 type II restriction endonuclease [Aequorivita sp. F7]